MMFVYAVGDAGPEVSAIQRELTALSFYKGPIGDHFDLTMSDAVGAFQTAKNLIADGKVGDRTWSALFGVAQPLVLV